jgi:dihydrofolate reductase
MRKVIASTYVTLDGYIDNPHLWSLEYGSEETAGYAKDLLFGADALLLGRVTYEGFAQAWPSMTDGAGFADRMNGMPKYVVSATLASASWNNSTIIRENVADAVAQLKRQPGGDILTYGCGRLTDTLRAHGLLDEYRLWFHPVLRGEGQRLFGKGTRATLELLDTTTFATGVVVHTYRPA